MKGMVDPNFKDYICDKHEFFLCEKYDEIYANNNFLKEFWKIYVGYRYIAKDFFVHKLF